MTTYSGNRLDVEFALASALPDFDAIRASGHESYGALADAVCALLVEHAASVPDKPMRAVQEHREGLSDEIRHAAAEAGRELGARFTTFWGSPAGACEGPRQPRAATTAPESTELTARVEAMQARYAPRKAV